MTKKNRADSIHKNRIYYIARISEKRLKVAIDALTIIATYGDDHGLGSIAREALQKIESIKRDAIQRIRDADKEIK